MPNRPGYDEWVSGGVTVSIDTPRHTHETEEDWLRRHADDVADAKLIWPEDPA